MSNRTPSGAARKRSWSCSTPSTGGCWSPTAAPMRRKAQEFGTLLFDLESDPGQRPPLNNPSIEAYMIQLLNKLLKANDAPVEQFDRLGL